MILFGQYTAKEREEALGRRREPTRRERSRPQVELPLKQIKTMPALFQPRELFPADAKRSEEHVKSLKRAVAIHGDIEPPMVIKLKGTGVQSDYAAA
jgi:hypothetical protein